MWKFIFLFTLVLSVGNSSWANETCNRILGSGNQVERDFQLSMYDPKFYEILSTLDKPEMVGKLITVRFKEDALGNKLSRPDVVTQLITSLEKMDAVTQSTLNALKKRSREGREFQETGAWIAYTRKGSYTSKIEVGTNGDFSWELYTRGYQEILEKIQAREGKVEIEDLEFFHTHLEAGEVFSAADRHTHQHFESTFRQYLVPGGTFASHAVPINGQVFFRYISDYK